MDDISLLAANMTATELMDYVVTMQYGFRPTILLIMYGSIAVLGLLGVVGNVVSMVIWTRPQVKSSTSVLLTALAASDSLILISTNTSLFLSILYYNYHDSPSVAYMDKFIYPYISIWALPVYRTAQTASIYLTFTITLERYIAVCRPFEARIVCTHSKACKYAAAVITASILYNLVGFFRQKVVARVDKNGDVTSYEIVDTELSHSSLYKSIYNLHNDWLYLVMSFLLPLMCIAVLNTLIYLEMKRMKKMREAITASQRKENRLTMMLVYVVTEFLVCSSVTVLDTTFRTLDLSDEQLGFKLESFYPLDMLFETFNSSSNVLAYLVFGSGFREAFLSTFSCCRGLCRLKLHNRTDNREMDVRAPAISKCQPDARDQTVDLQV